MNRNKVALIVGSFAGLWHLVWSILVSLGWAQSLMNWIYWLHFLNNPFQINGFNWSRAVSLMIVTFVVGYIFGWVFATIWNTVYKKK